jgi:Myb-like DNA-binding domain
MDLKDRFRICFPGGNKGSAEDLLNISSESTSTSPSVHTRSGSTTTEHSSSTSATSSTYPDPSPGKPNYPNLSQPFTISTTLKATSPAFAIAAKSRANQRVRKLWTEDEHQNLVKGFYKHGYQWTAIRNDTDLNLSHRKATDIRDKFRSLFPQQYMDAESGPPVGRRGSVSVSTSSTKGSSVAPTVAGPQTDPDARGGDTRKPVASLPVLPTGTKLPTPTRPEEGGSRDGVDASLEIPSQETSSAPNLTLPPLTLGDNDWDWGDNKLAPLLDWEEFGL